MVATGIVGGLPLFPINPTYKLGSKLLTNCGGHQVYGLSNWLEDREPGQWCAHRKTREGCWRKFSLHNLPLWISNRLQETLAVGTWDHGKVEKKPYASMFDTTTTSRKSLLKAAQMPSMGKAFFNCFQTCNFRVFSWQNFKTIIYYIKISNSNYLTRLYNYTYIVIVTIISSAD